MSETVTQVNETTQQIVRSRTCGLKDFYIALVQSNTATAYTAGTPVKLARAIKAKIDEKWTSEKIYSDDNTEEVITSYEGTDQVIFLDKTERCSFNGRFGHGEYTSKIQRKDGIRKDSGLKRYRQNQGIFQF